MLDYPSLYALAAVLREGSFERAARTLHVTPSAISQRIRLLEERAGCALVIRGQPCEATETGRQLCQHVDRVLLLEHELQSNVPSLLRDEQLWINVPIAVNADSLATWFAKAMPQMVVHGPVLLQLSVDDEGHTTEWLRSGSVLAAVTATEQPAVGCSSQPLGAMRYVAAASPSFVARHFPNGVDLEGLRTAPSLRFNAKDELQQRWIIRLCGHQVEPPRHALPSPQGFVAAAMAGMGWAMHPLALIADQLRSGQMVELVPNTPLDVPLYWQHTRAASTLLDSLTKTVVKAASEELRQA
ncbi:LysR family transcriptional regulator ArgP [Hydrogenophaga sp.]|uniref:LysR family transcriptional regulator ArgP n=1 Tax=Hydrogenophaga sp. TaxID=1904254 RepID=UPI00271698D4|nr:LysR family transcriptional regulator ArgP [Hydrogenophaga sp.]MDO8905624.1 LysR family transcriptional regulator ArgP [Hydrogenophaga sp.]